MDNIYFESNLYVYRNRLIYTLTHSEIKNNRITQYCII